MRHGNVEIENQTSAGSYMTSRPGIQALWTALRSLICLGAWIFALIVLPAAFMIWGPELFNSFGGAPRGHDRLVAAIASDDLRQVRLALAEGADVGTPNASGVMPLAMAAYASPPEIIAELIGAGADVSHISSRGVTALITAAQMDRIETVRLLLEAGADPDQHRPGGQTALCTAAFFGNLEIVGLLLDAGADADLPGLGGRTPLMQAASQGHGAIIEMLRSSSDESASRPTGRNNNLLLSVGVRTGLANAKQCQDDFCGHLRGDATPRVRRRAARVAEMHPDAFSEA